VLLSLSSCSFEMVLAGIPIFVKTLKIRNYSVPKK
jgi:hypothetical protein